MELKSSVEKKNHLGGILRIFAKSVRDVAGNKTPTKSQSSSLDDPSSEDKLSRSSSSEISPSERSVQKEQKRTHRANVKCGPVLAPRSRSISENDTVKASGDQENVKELKLIVPKTVSLDNLEHHSKENHPPSVMADMEDWGDDLLDVESSFSQFVSIETGGHQSDCSIPLAEEKNVTSHNSKGTETKQEVRTKTKKVTGHKRHKKTSFSKSPSTVCKETVSATGKDIQSKRTVTHIRKPNRKGVSVSDSVRDAGKKLQHLSMKSKDEKREAKTPFLKTEHSDSDLRENSGCKSLPPVDEDWSSELLDTSSCSSITTKDELYLTIDDRVRKKLLNVSTERVEKFLGETSDQKGTYHRSGVDSGTCPEEKAMVFIDDMCNPLDVTLTKTEDEDWSSDLMNVPSSKNTSPQILELEDGRMTSNLGPEVRRYLNVDDLCKQTLSQESTNCSTFIEQDDSCLEHDSVKTNDMLSEDVDDENNSQEDSALTVVRSSTSTIPDVFNRFVDDISDLASDHEPLSDLESQAPSTVELESTNNDTICSSDVSDNYDVLTQDEDQDHFPSYKSYQSRQRQDIQDKHDLNSIDRSQHSHKFLQHDDRRKKSYSSKEEIFNDKLYLRNSVQEDIPLERPSQNNPSPGRVNYYPFLSVPLESVKTRESVERLMDYIESHVQTMGFPTSNKEHSKSVWFNVERNRGRDELKVGFDNHPDHVSPTYPPGAYPWVWPCNPWSAYSDPTCPRFDMFDPRLSQNSAYYNAYYERFYEDCQRDYPYPYKKSWEDSVDVMMPSGEYQPLYPHQSAAHNDHRIVDYDSSSEDERLAMLATKRAHEHQTQEVEKKSYASCVTNNHHGSKRSLQETQGSVNFSLIGKDKVLKTSGNKLQRLGTPKQARVLLGNCVDKNRDIAFEASDMNELSGSERSVGKDKMSLVEHAKNICEQLKVDSSEDTPKKIVQSETQIESGKRRYADPRLWAQFRRNRNVVDEVDLDDSLEMDSCDGKENVASENMEEEVKSTGCYPYLTIGKIMSKTKDKASKSDTRAPPLITPAQWAAWATETSPKPIQKQDTRQQALRRDHVRKHTEDSSPNVYIPKSLGTPPEKDKDERNIFSSGQMTSPPVVPVCPQPFWGDPRMGFPYPPYYPSHWIPGFPGNFSPGYLPYPSPTTTSPTSSGCSTTSNAPTSTTATFPYQMAQYAARSRTVSAPPIEVEKIMQNSESLGEDKSCKNYFLGGKSRRISDSVLRSDAETFTPKRSSYASRLQNDARLNVNFPQLDWKIRFKSRCKKYDYSFIDSHCHLDFLYNREGFKGTFAKYMAKHEDTFPDNFEGCVAVFCNPATFLPKGGLWKDLALEKKVWLTMGCHPKMVTDFDTVAVEGLKQCIQNPRIIAVGEIGLDYSGTFRQHEDLQKKMFAFQLQLALDVKKPLVIHCRQAEEDCLAIMEQIVPRNYKIHCHCFTGSYEQCQKWLSKFPNLYIGLTNLVSFRSATPTHEVAKHIPLCRLLLETDTPYFIPRQVPKGECDLSHPGMAIFVAEEVARIKQIPVNLVLKACRSNTLDMYGV